MSAAKSYYPRMYRKVESKNPDELNYDPNRMVMISEMLDMVVRTTTKSSFAQVTKTHIELITAGPATRYKGTLGSCLRRFCEDKKRIGMLPHGTSPADKEAKEEGYQPISLEWLHRYGKTQRHKLFRWSDDEGFMPVKSENYVTERLYIRKREYPDLFDVLD